MLTTCTQIYYIFSTHCAAFLLIMNISLVFCRSDTIRHLGKYVIIKLMHATYDKVKDHISNQKTLTEAIKFNL